MLKLLQKLDTDTLGLIASVYAGIVGYILINN